MVTLCLFRLADTVEIPTEGSPSEVTKVRVERDSGVLDSDPPECILHRKNVFHSLLKNLVKGIAPHFLEICFFAFFQELDKKKYQSHVLVLRTEDQSGLG